MIPTRSGIYFLVVLIPLAVIASFNQIALAILAITVIGVVALALIEYVVLKRLSATVKIERQIPRSLSLGVPTKVRLRIHNSSSRQLSLSCYDLHSKFFTSKGQPGSAVMKPHQSGEVSYFLTPTRRGDHEISAVHCRLQLWMWLYQFEIPLEDQLMVYPNFSAQQHFSALAGASLQTQLGTEKRRVKGGGSDFHQLREYRDGDPLRSIDWKSTSRLRKLIAKEYQDERDQQIVVMLDCGRRMAHSDGELSHLDETLNAVMLLSHIAVKQGDSVGLMTFGGIDRWVAPVKGNKASHSLLKHMYDLWPTNESPDFILAASLLMQRMQKRALVIVVTNTRNNEQKALSEAITLMRKRHLVLVADLKESVVGEILSSSVEDYNDAMRWLGASNYQAGREEFHRRMKGYGALILDTQPSLLTGNLIERYHQIKNLGAL